MDVLRELAIFSKKRLNMGLRYIMKKMHIFKIVFEYDGQFLKVLVVSKCDYFLFTEQTLH